MTPRELLVTLAIAERQRRHDIAEQLALGAMAARGDEKALKHQIAELTND